MSNFKVTKMKKLLFAALAAVALVSCGKESATPAGETDGIPTRAMLTIKQPTTRAADPNPDAARGEGKINTAVIYVFNSAKALEAIASFDATDLTNGYKEVTVTTGQHHFLVAINAPSAIMPTDIVLGNNMADVEKRLLTVATLSTITTNDNFFMTNIDGPKSASLVSGGSPGSVPAANQITINVGRAMAKVNAQISATVSQPNGTLKNAAAGDVEYLVAGNPNKMYLFPVFVGSQLTAPYYNNVYNAGTDAANYFPQILSSDTHTTLTAASALTNAGTAVYAMENSNVDPKFGESTYVILTGIYAPKTWYKADGTVNTTAAVHGNDFWRIGIKNAAGKVAAYTERIYSETLLQTDIDRETSTVNDPDYTLVKYEGGRTFYGIWLADNSITQNPAAKYTVARNTYFNVTINEITGPGSDKPDLIPSPEDPIEVTAYIKATIDVRPWTVIEQGSSIGN